MALTPEVSIVTATYNRAQVLRHTIAALRDSTFTGWELLVVGDACTDETEEVVRAFGDSRIRFVNLPANSGDQAAPNNEGVRLARGRYLAYLNHDDLWTGEHLATARAALEANEADLVSTLTIAIDAENVAHLAGVCPRGTYEPWVSIPASSWLLRRELAERVGPWRRAAEVFASPSQEWLFRAWKQGAKLVSVPRATVVAVMSGGRKRSYVDNIRDNERYAALLRDDPAFLGRTLEEIAVRKTAETSRPALRAPLSRAVKNAVRRAALAAGIHPLALYNAVRFGRRGGFIESLRRTRGLPPLPRTGGTNV